MDRGESDLYTVPLTSLTFEAQNLLSCLLNTTKILLSEGPDKLPRDWRGLARLINISSEIANSYENDKTSKVIKYWILKKDSTATVGKLLEYVQKMDRYDIFDDLMDLSEKGQLIVNQRLRPPPPSNQLANRVDNQLMPYDEYLEENIITFHDKIHGYPQFYHAYVMYAMKDKDFVDELLTRMSERGYMLCTEDDLLPDHTTVFAPVSRLISSDRCHRIILVYSPDFLTSPANKFYMDYAQAVGIEMKKPKIIPCMYRNCQLPPQMTFYSKLYYNAPGGKSSYDFWDRLAMSLDVNDHHAPPRLNGITSSLSNNSYSAVNITELTTSTLANSMHMQQAMLALPAPPTSTSMNGLNRLPHHDTQSSMSLRSTTSDKKKSGQSGRLKSLKNIFSKKKKDPKQLQLAS
ncbi:myeloid differentiation primary response protein MyD88 [Pectinophora gossypiella]|uniref:myeloid differentiation primary response protein MyD88 n=1 Tax=Pectinophora gossypiella TaxID=13191 RepID=UPI00214E91D0|nr:myeloid differentiation primary response protein MyD88 [Pectinophora gossypiella]